MTVVPAPERSEPRLTNLLSGQAALPASIILPLAENWNGSAWAVKPAQPPDPNVTRSTMSSVSCSSLITCLGVGFYDTSGGVKAPVGEQYG